MTDAYIEKKVQEQLQLLLNADNEWKADIAERKLNMLIKIYNMGVFEGVSDSDSRTDSAEI